MFLDPKFCGSCIMHLQFVSTKDGVKNKSSKYFMNAMGFEMSENIMFSLNNPFPTT